jgi:apolipoprotein D and lipocalin family protein
MSFIRFRFVVIGLDPDYQWCVAGNPRRKSLWVLSRKPVMSQEVWDLATQIASRCA